MKITTVQRIVNTTNTVIVAFDVSKDKLDFFAQIETTGIDGCSQILKNVEGQISNSTRQIETCLKSLNTVANDYGFDSLRVVCESSGAYEKSLLHTARRLGFSTAYISGESVSKFKVVESNDMGKTDIKDARVIHLLAKLGKELTHRQLDEEYKALREYNHMYSEEQKRASSVKNQVHFTLKNLYCDYDFRGEFFYTDSGRVLLKNYSFNPYRIVKAGYKKFYKKMKKGVPRIRKLTLEKLWEAAESSVLHKLGKLEQEAYEYKLKNLMEEYLLREARKGEIEEKMVLLYRKLLERKEKIPVAEKGFCTEFRIARILGETGRLEDFKNSKQLLKYGGLNLRERKSGKYEGKVKLSKKGRTPLREVVGEGVFNLVKKAGIFGEYYWKKKGKGMSGTKAMVAVERKFLVAFYKLGLKGEEFKKEKLHCCESQQKKAS